MIDRFRLPRNGPLIGLGFVVMATAAPGASFFATEVITGSVGSPNQHPPTGSFGDPGRILDGPRGLGGGVGSYDVYNLGVGGSITVGFDGSQGPRAFRDGPGADFIVSENPFYAGTGAGPAFVELVFVEVSSDGTNFARFDVVSGTLEPVGALGIIDPKDVSGFAGIRPVWANIDTNTIDPFDPDVAGGDGFDLVDLADHPLVTADVVNLNRIRFIRLVDVPGDGSLFDQIGQPIYDSFGPTNGGADVDSVAIRHGFTFADMNDDGQIDNLDVALFVLAVQTGDAGDYDAMAANTVFFAADTNLDGVVTADDVPSFIDALATAGGSAPLPIVPGVLLPEPSTLVLLALSLASCCLRKRC